MSMSSLTSNLWKIQSVRYKLIPSENYVSLGHN